MGALRGLTFGTEVIPKSSVLHHVIDPERVLVAPEASWCGAHALGGAHCIGAGNGSGDRIGVSCAFVNRLPGFLRENRNRVERPHFSHHRGIENEFVHLPIPKYEGVVSFTVSSRAKVKAGPGTLARAVYKGNRDSELGRYSQRRPKDLAVVR